MEDREARRAAERLGDPAVERDDVPENGPPARLLASIEVPRRVVAVQTKLCSVSSGQNDAEEGVRYAELSIEPEEVVRDGDAAGVVAHVQEPRHDVLRR